MATSNFSTTQYTSENFVESAGAILFKLSTRQICLVHHEEKDEYLLAKGRRNIRESRETAAIREAEEETGFKCGLLPVTMASRVPHAVELLKHYRNEPRTYEGIREPFMATHRSLGEGNVKIIWWYIAAIDEEGTQGSGEVEFEAQLFSFDEALKVLTYQLDRDVVQKAIDIFITSFDE